MKRNRLAVAIARSIDAGDKLSPTPTMKETWDVRVGNEYRPKRANQHSKNIVVTAIRNDMIHYTKGKQIGSATYDDFTNMAGRLTTYNSEVV